MYFNPVIIGAIVVQTLVGAASRTAGAILGFLITAGIFLWGLNAYAYGDAIALFGIEISQGIFIMVCLVWFGIDVKELAKARGWQF